MIISYEQTYVYYQLIINHQQNTQLLMIITTSLLPLSPPITYNFRIKHVLTLTTTLSQKKPNTTPIQYIIMTKPYPKLYSLPLPSHTYTKHHDSISNTPYQLLIWINGPTSPSNQHSYLEVNSFIKPTNLSLLPSTLITHIFQHKQIQETINPPYLHVYQSTSIYLINTNITNNT